MSFLSKCHELTYGIDLDLNKCNGEMTNVLQAKLNTTLKIMTQKIGMIRNIEIPFITDLVGQVNDKNSDVYRKAITVPDIPSEIPFGLKENLTFGEGITHDDKAAIIKVLTAYIMLQN